MNKYIPLFVFILILFCAGLGFVFGGNIPQPPVLRNEPIEEQHYLKTIADNFNNLEGVTVNPDGARRGKYKDVVLLNSSGTYYIEVCVSSPSGTTWRGVQLTDVP